MPEQQGYIRHPAPSRIQVPISPVPKENMEIVERILSDAYQTVHERIQGALVHLHPEHMEKLEAKAEEYKLDEPMDFLRLRLNELSKYYLGYRTKLLWVRDNFNGKDVTLTNVSATLTELSEVLGLRQTDEIYRTISSAIDTALEKQYGKQR